MKNLPRQAVKNVTGTYSYPMVCLDIVIKVQPKTDLNECVTSITVQPDDKLQVNLEWKVISTSDVVGVIVHPDTDNHNMYLLDNSGKRLDHIATGGGTDQEVELINGQQKRDGLCFLLRIPPQLIFILLMKIIMCVRHGLKGNGPNFHHYNRYMVS